MWNQNRIDGRLNKGIPQHQITQYVYIAIINKLHNAQNGVGNKTACQCISMILIYFQVLLTIIWANSYLLFICIFISYENIYLLRYKASFYPHWIVNVYVNNILFHKRYRFSYLHIFVSSLPSCSAYHTIHKIRQRNSRISLIVIINVFTKQLY